MDLARSKSGLYAPNPGGSLFGFQRQGMDQRKKAGGVASFVGGGAGSNDASGNYTISAAALAAMGATVGDMVIVDAYLPIAGMTITTTGWTAAGPTNYPLGNNSNTILWRPLVPADLASGVVVSGMSTTPGQLALSHGVYRSAPVVVLRSSSFVTGGATCTVPGIIPSPFCIGLLFIADDRDGEAARVYPQNWAVRLQFNGGSGGSDGRADLLDMGRYLTGSDVVVGGYTGANQHGGFLLELRSQ